MAVIKGLFFDLDGTLVDSRESNILAYTKAFSEEGFNFTAEMYLEIHGMRLDAFARHFFPDITEEIIKKIAARKAAYYPDTLHLLKANRQLIDFLDVLRPHHQTVLVTMAKAENAQVVIKSLDIAKHFDFFIFGDDITIPKPHPESYLRALELTHLSADEVLVFEDSKSGIEAAKNAGISVVTITMPEEVVK